MIIYLKCPNSSCGHLCDSKATSNCPQCGELLVGINLSVFAAGGEHQTISQLPLSFQYEEEDIDRGIPPLEDYRDPFYAVAFAELAATIAEKLVAKEIDSSEYVNLLADLVFTEFEQKDRPFYWVPVWFKAVNEAGLTENQKNILMPIMADLSAIVFTIYAFSSGYKFNKLQSKRYSYSDIIPIRKKLLTDEVKNQLTKNDPISYSLFNPILDTVLSFMPYRDEAVDNQLSAYLDLQKKRLDTEINQKD